MNEQKMRMVKKTKEQCMSPEHNPPMHIHLQHSGTYEYKCPVCGGVTVFKKPVITCAPKTTNNYEIPESLQSELIGLDGSELKLKLASISRKHALYMLFTTRHIEGEFKFVEKWLNELGIEL